MSISINSAISAYNNAAKVANSSYMDDNAGVQGQANAASGSPFAALLEKSMHSSIGSIRNAEKTAIANLTKQADITDVVTAVATAESTLKTVIAVRDRLVNAFQELSKMPI